jgi:hypothetical protein
MANYCWNWVGFEGNKDTLKDLQRRFEEGVKSENLVTLSNILFNEEKRIEEISSLYDEYGTRWWDIDIDRNEIDNDFLIVVGDSAWSPPSILIKRISEVYRVKATIEFEEMGNDFGGSETFINGELVEEVTMTYREWNYHNSREYAIAYIIEDLQDSPEDYYESAEELLEDLSYMIEEDRNEILSVYLESLKRFAK